MAITYKCRGCGVNLYDADADGNVDCQHHKDYATKSGVFSEINNFFRAYPDRLKSYQNMFYGWYNCKICPNIEDVNCLLDMLTRYKVSKKCLSKPTKNIVIRQSKRTIAMISRAITDANLKERKR